MTRRKILFFGKGGNIIFGTKYRPLSAFSPFCSSFAPSFFMKRALALSKLSAIALKGIISPEFFIGRCNALDSVLGLYAGWSWFESCKV
jgi:hypothetical protein